MDKSFFIDYVNKYLKGVINAIVSNENEALKNDYLYKKLLTEQFSANMLWTSSNIMQSIPLAEVVSTNSSLPLKDRGSLEVAHGNIPKLGIKYFLSEDDIAHIRLMQNSEVGEQEIAKKIFEDSAKVIKAIEERIELMFYQALSNGAILVEDGENKAGLGIRANFAFKDPQKVAVKWGTGAYTPITDLRKMFDTAYNNNVILSNVYMDAKTFDTLRKSDEAKQLAFAFSAQGVVANNKLPMPGKQVLLDALKDEFGADFHIVRKQFNRQLTNGLNQTEVGWKEGFITATPNDVVGRLVYGQLVEGIK